MSRSTKKGERLPQLTYKPFATARFMFTTPKDHKLAINLSRRVHSYFTSTFAKMPLLSKLPNDPDAEAQAAAERVSFWFDALFTEHRMKAGQPRLASWLSNRGDAVVGVEWNAKEGKLYPRAYDPQWCYPTLEPFDVGGVSDMLITFSMGRAEAAAMYDVVLPATSKRDAQVFIYWNHEERIVQVEGKKSARFSFKHELQRAPFRWLFGNADGMYAQSDVRDIPSLQDFYNENLILAMDTIRKQVDAAWIVFGHNKNLTPIPGSALGVPRQDAKLERFEAGGNPEVIMQVMQMLESGVEASTGISPASSRGHVGGTSTGVGVRNQVQAIEARNEARKSTFEDAYEQLATLSLQVVERCLKKGVKVRSRNGQFELKPEDVDGNYLCEATYGGFVGMDLAQRIQASLQGLGRIYGLTTAVRLADIPGVNPSVIEKEVDAYQKNLAIVAATSQSIAQQAAQSAQASPQDMGQQPPPAGAVPQKQQMASPPGPSQMGVVSIGDIERTLEAVKPRLHGSVWAIGELAIAGMAAKPMLMVSSEKDLPVVSQLMQHLRTFVMPGEPGEMPNLKVA
jgi:hypothetical protein